MAVNAKHAQNRQTAMNGIIRTRDYIQDPGLSNVTLMVARNLLSAAEMHYQRFEREHLAMGLLGPQEFAEHDQIYARAETMMLMIRADLGERIQELTPLPEVVIPDQPRPINVAITAPDMSLTQNTWGTFTGEMAEWQSFRDRFVVAVHNNDQVPSVFKLQKLIASLKGEALKIIGTRQATDAGYAGAWARLCEVYDDNYLIISAVLKTLFSLPSMQRPTHDGFRNLIDTMHEATRQLNSLGLPVANLDQILIYVMVMRLDTGTASAWQLKRKPKKGLYEFLEGRARSVITINSPGEPSKTGAKRKANGDPIKYEMSRSTAMNSMPAKKANTYPNLPCPTCNEAHPLCMCSAFKNLPLAARKEAAIKLKVCFNCLKLGHGVRNCKFGPCARCPNGPRHDSMLCPLRDAAKGTAAMFSAQGKAAKKKMKKEN